MHDLATSNNDTDSIIIDSNGLVGLNLPEVSTLTAKVPQALIHITHKCTLLEYKLWMCLCINAINILKISGTSDNNNQRFYLTKSAIESVAGVNCLRNDLLLNYLDRLKSSEITINYLKKDHGVTVDFTFISDGWIEDGGVYYVLPDILIALLMSDDSYKIFHIFDWSYFNRFNGKYESIIYKLCKDYLGTKKTPSFTIEQFREYCGVEPTFENKYFVRDVINKSVDFINSEDLDITIEACLTYGRYKKIKSIHFTMRKRDNVSKKIINRAQQALTTSNTELSEEVLQKLNEIIIISMTDFKKLVARHGDTISPEDLEVIVRRTNTYINGLIESGKPVNNPVAIYTTAIKQRWGITQPDLFDQDSNKQGIPQVTVTGQNNDPALYDAVVAASQKENYEKRLQKFTYHVSNHSYIMNIWTTFKKTYTEASLKWLFNNFIEMHPEAESFINHDAEPDQLGDLFRILEQINYINTAKSSNAYTELQSHIGIGLSVKKEHFHLDLKLLQGLGVKTNIKTNSMASLNDYQKHLITLTQKSS